MGSKFMTAEQSTFMIDLHQVGTMLRYANTEYVHNKLLNINFLLLRYNCMLCVPFSAGDSGNKVELQVMLCIYVIFELWIIHDLSVFYIYIYINLGMQALILYVYWMNLERELFLKVSYCESTRYLYLLYLKY